MSQKPPQKPSRKSPSTAAERQAALDNIPAEDLAKINAHKASTEGALKVDQEWLLLAEFAREYGWNAYLDAKTDKITAAEMLTLVEASRKLRARDMFENAQTSFIGGASSQSGKKATSVFKSMTKAIIKRTKVDE